MNSTKFHTLTEFVKYLGRTGKCRVDETEKGWFISLIQEDPMEKLSTERRLKRDRRESDHVIDIVTMPPVREEFMVRSLVDCV